MSEEITYRYEKLNITLPQYLHRFKAIEGTVVSLKAMLDDPSFEWGAEQKIVDGDDLVRAVGIETPTEDERRLGQVVLWLEKEGNFCRSWRELCHPDDNHKCERCGTETGSGCPEVKETEKSLWMFVPRREKKIQEYRGPRTDIDSLDPVADLIRKNHPNGFTMNGISATNIDEIVAGTRGEVVIVGYVERIMATSLNAENKVKQRGGRRITGPHMVLNLSVNDDGFDDILCQVGRHEFARLAPPITDHGKAGKAVWAFRGVVPANYRMIYVRQAELIGDLDWWKPGKRK
jgi:hypothetical protein